mmetsp:Transcript_18777/g.43104  ORF Transcript_18777/g.43104 Transcript_18777/m.43104 type:complete len:86 (-) Transcript_18777:58-315(-)
MLSQPISLYWRSVEESKCLERRAKFSEMLLTGLTFLLADIWYYFPLDTLYSSLYISRYFRTFRSFIDRRIEFLMEVPELIDHHWH